MTYSANPKRYQEMPYRPCGNSGLRLPALSLGLWHNFGDIDNFETQTELITQAFDRGVTHFDLANNYGPPPGSAERNFGRILHRELAAHRDEIIIASKAGHYMWEGPYGDGGSRKSLMASIDQSLKRLQTDYVDIFYSHRYDPATPLDETLGALCDIVRQGKALYIGLSKYPVDKLLYAFNYLRTAGVPCLVYQDRYNMLTRQVETHHLPAAESNGTGFVAFSPLAQGMLTGKYQNGIPDDSRAARPEGYLQTGQITDDITGKVTRLQQIARQRGQSTGQMALVWVLRHSAVTSVLVGARNIRQLDENLDALRQPGLSDEETGLIENILRT